MAAVTLRVSSDIIAYTADGRKIVRSVVTATDTGVDQTAFTVDKLKSFYTSTSGWAGFTMASTSGDSVTSIIPVVLSGIGVTNALAIDPGGNSQNAVFRILSFEGAD